MFVTHFTQRHNNCPQFFLPFEVFKTFYYVSTKIIKLGYADLVSVNFYHQKAHFSRFKG